jgi:hypothetical protein
MDNQEMENKNQEGEMESRANDWKNWIQDNMRILLSIVIVIAIAGGVYSYSKRSMPDNSSETLGTTQVSMSDDEEQSDQEELMSQDENKDGTVSQEEISAADENDSEEAKSEDSASSIASSQETGESFIETAGRGDGLTHLGRRALANYLEKNPDSSLTVEHKIYIEDYLRKNVGYNKGVRVGASVEFSKKLVEEAIQKSKTLNDRQLQNLSKYAKRVPSLS